MSKSKAFTIKPLVWEYSGDDTDEEWRAPTIFCNLYVRRTKYNNGGQWLPWKFEYCLEEYYHQHSEEADSAEDGKAKAEAWYHKTLMPALELK